MGDAKPSVAATDGPPRPHDAANVDELVARLRELRAWVGVSYRELHRRLVRRRRARGIAEEPAYATVYRCLQVGRSRLDVDLVVDLVAVLVGDEVEATQWRQAYARLDGRATEAAYATVFDALPEDVDDFTGRDAELATLVESASTTTATPALGTGRSLVLAIEGMAGIGKTALAVRAGHRLVAELRPEVILSANLRGYDPQRAPAEPTAVLDGFLRLLGEPGQRIQALDLDRRVRRYRELLSGRTALVLLDNAGSEDQIQPLLPEHPTALVIVTSRHRVVQLPSARHLPLKVFDTEQAVNLLRHRAGPAVDADPAAAVRIVEQVGRLPLAVALAGSRIEALTGWTLADHVDHLVERGETLRLDQGVELAFATSYEALPPSLRRMLRRLALHPGRDWDAYSAAALAGTDLTTAEQQLGDLVDRSLLTSPVSSRYELHDLVRIFAVNRAHDEDAPTARREALGRLLDHYRWAATTAMDTYAPSERQRRPRIPEPGTAVPVIADRPAAIAWLDTEHPILVSVGTYAAERGWPQHVSDLSAVLAPYLLLAARFADAARLHQQAIDVISGAPRAVALKNLGVIRWHQGQRTMAFDMFSEALILARAAEDRRTEARLLNNLGNVCHNLGRYAEAFRYYEQALELSNRVGDRTGACRVLMNLGISDRVVGDYESAREHHQRALSTARAIADRSSSESHALENLGSLYNVKGDYDEASRCALAAMGIAEEIGDRTGVSEALTCLGTSYAGTGRFDDAVRHQRRALSIAQEIGSRTVEVYARLGLGNTLNQRGQPNDAMAHFQRAKDLAEQLHDTYSEAQAYDGLGDARSQAGDPAAAESHWRAALGLYDRLGLSDTAKMRAKLAASTGRPPAR